MIAACLYFVIREERFPRVFEDILRQSHENEKIIRKSYKALIIELGLKAPPVDPRIYIPMYSDELEFGFLAEKAIRKVLNTFLSRNSNSGKQPRGLLAGAFYLVSQCHNLGKNQKQIAKIMGVTEVTLRTRYREIINKLGIKN